MNELENLKDEFVELKNDVKNTDKKLDRIIYILDNDLGTGQPGLVSQVQDIKKNNTQTLSELKQRLMNLSMNIKKQRQ